MIYRNRRDFPHGRMVQGSRGCQSLGTASSGPAVTTFLPSADTAAPPEAFNEPFLARKPKTVITPPDFIESFVLPGGPPIKRHAVIWPLSVLHFHAPPDMRISPLDSADRARHFHWFGLVVSGSEGTVRRQRRRRQQYGSGSQHGLYHPDQGFSFPTVITMRYRSRRDFSLDGCTTSC
jgi:hypothetical protein